ncbi:MAG: vitamin K epoxide reductase family protein [Ardenticatenaceae bacterium]|nr:vitamin K epoxide reductase family protein [Ardenticatenaceae bacterium]
MEQTRKIYWPIHTIQLLSVIGLLIAFYLYLYHEQVVDINCAADGFFDCSRVSGPTSPYSSVGDLPIALIGLAGYAAIFLVTWARQLWSLVDRYCAAMLLLFTGLGMGFTIYLKALELTVIHAICEYCLYSAVVMAIMFGLALYDFRQKGYSPLRR